MAAGWSLKGTYFEACNCSIACPCIFLQPPTKGYCQAFVAWHIDEGHYGDTRLDGLNVAVWLHSPEELTAGNWRLALYIDAKANEAQHKALAEIYSGKAGGHPAVLASFVTELLGVSAVPIEYRVEGKRRALRIPDVGEIDMETLAGEAEAEVTISGHPLAVSPGNPVVLSKAKRLRYRDHGVDWYLSGTTGLSAPFAYQP